MKPAMIQTNGSYAIILEFVSGLIEAPFLDAINSIVKEEGARIHLTTSQKIMLLDLSKKSAKRAKERLDALDVNYKFPKQVYQPKVCVGSAYCRLGLTDTLGLGERIYEKYAHVEIPYKLKIAVSGCPASCAGSTLADIGFIGRNSGYQVYAGGKSGMNPGAGKLLAKSVSENSTLQIIENVINLYHDNYDPGEKGQRIFHIIEKMGFDKFKTFITTMEPIQSKSKAACGRL